MDFWGYAHGRTEDKGQFLVMFYQPAASGPYRLWTPAMGFDVLAASGPARGGSLLSNSRGAGTLEKYCGLPKPALQKLHKMIAWLEQRGDIGVRLAVTPSRPDPEWLRTFHALSTDLATDAVTFSPELDVAFPGIHQTRAVVRATVSVPTEPEEPDAEVTAHAFELYGEVLRDEKLLETFRYRFELPSPPPGQPLPLVFERMLRPGEYTMVLRLVDGVLGRQARLERAVDVPELSEIGRSTALQVGSSSALPSEGSATASLRLVAPQGALHTGGVRVEAEAGAAVSRVAFHLDGRPLLTKNRPPFSVELSLGSIPRTHTLRAAGYDPEGRELAVDELVLNPAPHRFEVRLIEPVLGIDGSGRLTFRVDPIVPEGRSIETVELFVEERQVATLYQPPWFHELALGPGPLPAWVRAVGTLDDGTTGEDVVGLQGGGQVAEELDIDVVEVYTTVVDRSGHPVQDLKRGDFTVLEDGATQPLRRFEHVTNLPLHVALLLDTSASMEEDIGFVQSAGLRFFDDVLGPDDRGAVITFSERPRLVTPFTDDLDRLSVGLVGLAAERSTAFFDAAMFGLNYFQGIQGQRALLILSDGEDRHSKYRIEDLLQYARHAGVTIYTIGFAGGLSRHLGGGRHLETLAAETGGRSFVLPTMEELAKVYAAIEQDLRSRYLLVYQAPEGAIDQFRRIDVRVARAGTEARHMVGYYP
jgi:Ca-activated chloride channel family protein